MKSIALHTKFHTFLLLAIVTVPTALPENVRAQSATSTADNPGVLDTEIVRLESNATTTATSSDVTSPRATPSSYTTEELPSDEVFGDFVIGPGRFDLQLAPGESRTVELIVSNRMGDRRLFSFETEDTTGSETGDRTVKLLGEERGPYTLRDYISVPQKEFYLDHAERARIPVTVRLPADAEPGGRYGSLLVTMKSNPVDAQAESGAQPASVIVSRIASLFFVRTPGAVDYDLQLQSFSTLNDRSFFVSGPISFLLEHENSGTVHTTPYGRITVTNIFGEEVGVRNLEPWFVMPESARTREIEWNRDFLFGRYTATAEINRGYDDIIDTNSHTFWVIPWKLALMIFGGLFLVFLFLRFIFTRFEFKRKT